MKTRIAILVGLAGFGSGSTQAQVNPSPKEDSLQELKPATLSDINRFELVLPLGAEFNFLHGDRSQAVMTVPFALGLQVSRFQVGLKTLLSLRSINLDLDADRTGAIIGYGIIHFPWDPESRGAFFAGPQFGWGFVKERRTENSLRIGFTIGRVRIISKVDHPGILRWYLNFSRDFVKHGKDQNIIGLGASFGISP